MASLSRLLVVAASISYPLVLATDTRHIHWVFSGALAVGLFFLYLFLTGNWPPGRARAGRREPGTTPAN